MRRRRPPRAPTPAGAALLATGALVVGVYAAAVVTLDGDGGGAAGSMPFAPPAAAAEPGSPFAPGPVFAVGDGVALRLPSQDVVAVAFHEASYRDAVALRPTGVCASCHNRWRFDPPRPRRDDLSYIVTHTRGRSTPATSAADVVVPTGAAVASPVSGVVTEVRRYRLYRRYPDVRVEIRPDAAPDRRVVMLHLANVPISVGERVEAATTPVGVARRFGFDSQVDRYVRGRNPHVHIEVKDPARARRPPSQR